MSGFVLAVGILVLALGGLTWFLISRNSRGSKKSLAEIAPAPAVPATTDGDGESGETSEELEDGYVDEDDDNSSTLPWRQKVTLAGQKKSAGEYDTAIDMYEEALEAAREELGRDSTEVADILLKQGAAYQARDDEEDDEDTFPPCYPRALSILEQRYGVFDTRLLPAINHLISFFDQTGRHSEAETLQRRLEDIMSRNRRNREMACASPAVAETEGGGTAVQTPAVTVPQVNMQAVSAIANTAVAVTPAATTGNEPLCEEADAHMARFEYDEAIEAYESVLEKVRESYGRDSMILVPILVGLGKAYQDRDDESDNDERYNDPDDYYLRALAIIEREAGPFDARLTPIIIRLVSFYDEIGEHHKAETMIRRLDAIERVNIWAAERETQA